MILRGVWMGVLVVWWFCAEVAAKLQTGSLRLDRFDEAAQWHYVTKFGYTIGKGIYEMRLRLRPQEPIDSYIHVEHDAQVDFELYLDEDWKRVESLPHCQRPSEGKPRKVHRSFPIGRHGDWGPWHGAVITGRVRAHIWYFAISDCQAPSSRDTAYFVDYEIRMKQFDGSELSIEFRHMFAANMLALFGLSVFLARFIVEWHNLTKETGAVHPIIWMLVLAVILQCTALALHAMHLWMYEWDGVGSSRVDCAADVLCMLSQVLIATLLITIAQGYTLLHDQPLPGARVMVPVGVLVASLHVLLVSLGKLQGEISNKHHEHNGAVGCAFLAIRLLLYWWFISAGKSLKQRSGFKLESFMQRFQIAGSAYFLSYPVILIVVQVFAEYLQHPILQLGLLVMQGSTVVCLASLFLSRGVYYEVSAFSASLLPERCGLAFGGSLPTKFA